MDGISSAQNTRLTIWIPSGRLILLPCNVNYDKYQDIASNINEMDIETLTKSNLVDKTELGVVTIWYNAIGETIHIGQVLPVHLPITSPGEIDFELSLSSHSIIKREGKSTLELPLVYAMEIGSSLDILHRNSMTTVTCRTFKSNKAGMFKRKPTPDTPFSLKDEMQSNQFSLIQYVQPIVVWKFAIPDEYNKIIANSKIESIAKTACSELRNIEEFQTSPCLDMSINIVRIKSSGIYFRQLSVGLFLSSSPLNLLMDPTITTVGGNASLSYLHAALKHRLDVKLTNGLIENPVLKNPRTKTLKTTVEVTCPTGMQLRKQIPSLAPLSLEHTHKATSTGAIYLSKNDSAYILRHLPLSCESCPAGYAPRTPYSFLRCVPCPKGFFRGSTGWPASSGCLSCPLGFTTLQESSKSPDECIIDGGTLTNYLVGFAAWAYRNFLELVIAGHEASLSYTKRVLLYVGEEASEQGVKPVHWINRIKPAALAFGVLYVIVLLFLLALFVYRVLLIVRFKQMHSKHLHLLRKGVVIGNLNAQEDAKDLLRQDFAEKRDISDLNRPKLSELLE